MPLIALFVLHRDVIDGLTPRGGPKKRTPAEIAVLFVDDAVPVPGRPLFEEGRGPAVVPPDHQADEGRYCNQAEKWRVGFHASFIAMAFRSFNGR